MLAGGRHSRVPGQNRRSKCPHAARAQLPWRGATRTGYANPEAPCPSPLPASLSKQANQGYALTLRLPPCTSAFPFIEFFGSLETFHIGILFFKEALKLRTESARPIRVPAGVHNFRNYGPTGTAKIVIFCRTARTRRHASSSSSHITEAPYETERSMERRVRARPQRPGSSRARSVPARPAPAASQLVPRPQRAHSSTGSSPCPRAEDSSRESRGAPNAQSLPKAFPKKRTDGR